MKEVRAMASKKKVNSKSSVKHFQDGVALKSNQKVSQPHATKKEIKKWKSDVTIV